MHRLSLAGRGGSRGQLHATARVDPLLPVVSGRFPALPHAQKDTRRATETRAGTRRPRRGLEVCHRQKRGQRVAIGAS